MLERKTAIYDRVSRNRRFILIDVPISITRHLLGLKQDFSFSHKLTTNHSLFPSSDSWHENVVGGQILLLGRWFVRLTLKNNSPA